MNEVSLDLSTLIPLLIPILVIQIGLQIYALVDLYRQPKVRGQKWIWVLVIILGEILGPIIYLVFGRKDV